MQEVQTDCHRPWCYSLDQLIQPIGENAGRTLDGSPGSFPAAFDCLTQNLQPGRFQFEAACFGGHFLAHGFDPQSETHQQDGEDGGGSGYPEGRVPAAQTLASEDEEPAGDEDGQEEVEPLGADQLLPDRDIDRNSSRLLLALLLWCRLLFGLRL